jgi:hypothetical protein
MKATLRHGEAVDMGTGLLVDVECTGSLAPDHGLGCVHMSFIARGDATGMSAHDLSWRQLALRNNASAIPNATEAELEAFTPAFQFSAFRFIEVTYDMTYEDDHRQSEATAAGAAISSFQPPDKTSLACHRIGAGFDWIGDVVVAPPVAADAAVATASNGESQDHEASGGGATTAAHRFNAVVAATRSTATSNYCPRPPGAVKRP